MKIWNKLSADNKRLVFYVAAALPFYQGIVWLAPTHSDAWQFAFLFGLVLRSYHAFASWIDRRFPLHPHIQVTMTREQFSKLLAVVLPKDAA